MHYQAILQAVSDHNVVVIKNVPWAFGGDSNTVGFQNVHWYDAQINAWVAETPVADMTRPTPILHY